MVNEEMISSSQEMHHRVSLLEKERLRLDERLERLYDALETGKLELNDLAPRIREQKKKRDELLKAERGARSSLDGAIDNQIDADQVMAHVRDLGRILELGTSEERREFLKTFVKRVFWNDPEVTLEYTLPLPPAKLDLWLDDVAHFESFGGPARIRTWDQSVMSRPLCR